MNRLIIAVATVLAVLFTISAGNAENLKLALIVKNTGNGFFDACNKGAEEAATEIGGIEVIYTAPSSPTASGQIEIIRRLIAQDVAGIIISANDPDALTGITGKAMEQGIPVISFDSGINPGGRLVHLAPSDAEFIGYQQVDLMGQAIGYSGQFAIVSASPKAGNQNAWIAYMEEALKKDGRYKDMELVEITYGYDLTYKSYQAAQSLLQKYPDLKGIEAPSAVALPAVSKAVIDGKRVGSVYVTGLGLPSEVAGYVKSGTVKNFALWNPIDLGYCSVYIMNSLLDKAITGRKGDIINAGRIGELQVLNDGLVIMGAPFVFNPENIDDWAQVF